MPTHHGSRVDSVLDSRMLPRGKSIGIRRWPGPLLVLSAWCSWGCPQLRSDDFGMIDGSAQGQAPPVGGNGGDGGEPDSAGTGGSGGSDPQNTSGAGGSGGTSASAPGAPAVLSVSPSNGAAGVAADAVVTVTFSEPMNTGAVEAAYTSSDLPASSVRFQWSTGDTVLQITPDRPLSLATGSSPTTTVARRYAFEIGISAVDLDGEALAPFSANFTTAREITETLDAQQDRTLTGNYRSDDVYGDNSCQFADSTTTCIGDSSNDNTTYRGFITFDLGPLPAQIQELSAARLGMLVDDVRFTPFPDLGDLVADRVTFDTIDLAAFTSPALGSAIFISSSAGVGAALSADVLSSVQADLEAGTRSQFRLRFSTDTDADATGDLVQVLSTTEELRLTYLIP